MTSNESETIFRKSDKGVLFGFTLALSFLLYAPLLIVLTSRGTAFDYWLAGGVTILWLATGGIYSWMPIRGSRRARGHQAPAADNDPHGVLG